MQLVVALLCNIPWANLHDVPKYANALSRAGLGEIKVEDIGGQVKLAFTLTRTGARAYASCDGSIR